MVWNAQMPFPIAIFDPWDDCLNRITLGMGGNFVMTSP